MEEGIMNEGMLNPNGDSQLFVEFYKKAVQNNAKSETEGRPIFEERDYIRIHIPGDQSTVIDRPVNDDDKKRFPFQWARYLNNQQSSISGTPIEQWPALSLSQIEELKYLKFMTVESLADASDVQLQRIANGMSLRARANAYLTAAKDNALPEKLAAELAHRDETIKILQEQVARLADQSAQRKPGRPSKRAEAA